MSQTRRIFLNVAATYGRSMYSIACGLFTSRWVLEALGQEDFGLYGVVCGLVVFIGFLNDLLGTAVGRFYAVAVGASGLAADRGAATMECRRWFSSAVLVHTAVPLALMAVGWPAGEHAIRTGWIVVAPDRLAACLWAFRFACLACFASMVSVPFQAMFVARQRIAELAAYSFATTTCNMFFCHYMVTHPGVWLARYAAWMAALAAVPPALVAFRARRVFPECRLLPSELFDARRLRALARFAGWQAFGGLGALLRYQGVLVLLNRHGEFGEMRNSSMTVANQLAAQTDTLAGAMVGAFQPAVASAWGAGDCGLMRALAFRACKFGALLSLLFVLPLSLELPGVLRLWLKTPPAYAAGLCWSMLAVHIIDRAAAGHLLAVSASGRIARYQAFLGGSLILTLPLAWLLLAAGCGIYSAGWAMVATMALCAGGRVWFARTIVGMSARRWLRETLLPLAALVVVGGLAGLAPVLLLPPSPWRIAATTLLVEAAFLPFAWRVVLDAGERDYARARFAALKARLSR